MRNAFTTIVLVIGIAVASLAARPVRASSNDLGQILAGLTALFILGQAVEAKPIRKKTYQPYRTTPYKPRYVAPARTWHYAPRSSRHHSHVPRHGTQTKWRKPGGYPDRAHGRGYIDCRYPTARVNGRWVKTAQFCPRRDGPGRKNGHYKKGKHHPKKAKGRHGRRHN